MRTKFKRIVATIMCIMLMVLPMTVYAESAESDVDIQPHTLTVQVTGSGTVSVEGKGVTIVGDNMYSVRSGEMVTVTCIPGEGQELFNMILDDTEVSESFGMPFKDAVLQVTFKEGQPEVQQEVESSVSDGEPEQKSEETGIENEEQEKEQEIVFQDHIVAKPMANTVRLVRDPYVGMVLNGSNASVLFQGVPGTAGTFLVSINDGNLAGTTGTGYCLDPGAANPGEGSPVICTWTATCTEIIGDMATWYFVMTPPGVAAPGSTLGYQRVGMTVSVPFESKGQLELYKASANPELTNNNSVYSLEGGVYGLYQNNVQVATATTNAAGYAIFTDITAGQYTLREITAPPGYALDPQTYTVTINSSQVTRIDVKDIPQNDPVAILLGKVDRETTQNMPQGTASLQGAEFTVKYYDGFYNTDPAEQGKEAVRTWVFATNANGFAYFADEWKVSGDAFYYDLSGNETVPLGTITIQETKAPTGYLLNNEIFIRQITAEGYLEGVETYNAPTIPEDVIRGDLQIVKFGQDADDTTEQKTPLSGIIFSLTSKTTGEQFEIVTNENGYASTQQLGNPRGGLAYDTYIVHEKNTPPGFKPVDDFEITISEEGQTLYYILEDKLIVSPVQLVKVDATTGNTIPLADAEFQLLDKDKNVITMTTHYPTETVHETFKTDATGRFTLPETLTSGVYYFREVNAPNGYLLNGQDIQFEITEAHDWDAPFVVTFEDTPAMGQIVLTKTDGDTDEPLEGAEFSVTAAEDIVTPDGTIRATAGEVVDTITTDTTGTARSKELFLGKYTVTETVQPVGFVLPTTTWDVELTYKDQNTAIVTGNIEVQNKPTKITIKKVEAETGQPIEGIEFAVWNTTFEDSVDPEMAVKEKYVTDANGTISITYLEPGTYCVQETATLPGYVLDDTVREFTIDENGMFVAEAGTATETGTLEFVNDYTKLHISKQDATTGKELPGARMELRDTEGNLVAKWTSGDKPYVIERIKPGDYILHEEAAPAGYKLAKDISFTVEETGVVQKIVMEDEYSVGSLKVSMPGNGWSGVKTGDIAHIAPYVIAVIIAGTAVTILIRKKRKGNKDDEK